MAKLQLKENTLYRLADGTQEGPLLRSNDEVHPWRVRDFSRLYTAEGKRLGCFGPNIIAEWTEEPALQDGDVVHVRGTVEGDGVRIALTWRPLKCCDVVHIEPRPLKEGDQTQFGEIIKIWGDYAWCDQAGYAGGTTHKLADLKRAEAR